MTRGVSLTPEYAVVRGKLAMHDALHHLGLEPDARGRYWCLVHDDQRPGGRPSADVWETEDGDLLSCWSCGSKLDVIQVIAHVQQVDLLQALKRAKEWAPRERIARKTVTPPDPIKLEREYMVSTSGVRYPNDRDPVELFRTARLNAGQACPPVRHLTDAWGWRGDFRGRVVIPWRDASGDIVAVKYRVPGGWSKTSRPGSRFRLLYGLWRLLEDPVEIWLCEGESDASFASWSLEPEGIAVLAVGSATQRPTVADLEVFRDRRAVIAMDPDRAGQGGADRWRAELARVGCEIWTAPLAHGDLCEQGRSALQIRDEMGMPDAG